MIQIQLPPKHPQELLLHISHTSENFLERFAAHSMVFRRRKKVRIRGGSFFSRKM